MQQIDQPAPTRALPARLAVLPDQPERWHAGSAAAPLTWDQARERVAQSDAADGARTDLAIGEMGAWVLGPRPSDGVACLAPIPLPGRPSPGLIPLRESAFRHVCAMLGAPAGYMLKLPAKLATACLSTGTAELPPGTGKLLRLAGGQARALASERYAPLDNEVALDTAERTLRALGILGDVRVSDLALGPTMSLRVILPGENVAIKAGDVISTGFDLINGEILNRSISLTPVTYRLVCTNGMRSWDKGSARRWNHVGDPKRLHEAFADALPVALAEANGLRERMRASVDRLIDDALGEIEGLSAFGFEASETREIARDIYDTRGVVLPASIDAWGDMIRATGPISVYDVANAITHVAQTRKVDARLTWEEAGGAYITRRMR